MSPLFRAEHKPILDEQARAGGHFDSAAAAKAALFDYLEVFYNTISPEQLRTLYDEAVGVLRVLSSFPVGR